MTTSCSRCSDVGCEEILSGRDGGLSLNRCQGISEEKRRGGGNDEQIPAVRMMIRYICRGRFDSVERGSCEEVEERKRTG